MKHLNWLYLLLCLLLSCKSEAEKLQYLLCKDSIQYWNYEWPRDNADRHGFTYSFDKNGECVKYSFRKKDEQRQLFPDDSYSGKEKWYILNDSLMYFYGSYQKIMSYTDDTIYLRNLCDVNDRTFLTKVKGELNIVEKDTPVLLKIADFPIVRNLGSFPYIKPLHGFKFTDTVFRSNYEKYFYFARDTIHNIKGDYFHARIESLHGDLDIDDVNKEYYEKIEAAGGVLVSIGSSIPDFALAAIKKNKPSFVKDLYNYKSYFMQYVVRISEKENVWIEFILNREERIVDLTVVKENQRIIFESPTPTDDSSVLLRVLLPN